MEKAYTYTYIERERETNEFIIAEYNLVDILSKKMNKTRAHKRYVILISYISAIKAMFRS